MLSYIFRLSHDDPYEQAFYQGCHDRSFKLSIPHTTNGSPLLENGLTEFSANVLRLL